MLCGNGGVVLGQHKVPSGVAALLVGSEPLWVVILDWLFFSRRRPSGGSLFGLLLGFAGVALLVAPWEMRGADRVDPLSAFIIIAAALCWAYGSLYSRTAVLPSSPLMSTALQMLAGGLLLLLMGSLRGEWLHFRTENFSSLSVAAWGYLCLFGSIVGFTAYMYLLKTVGAARASTYAYVNPVVAVFLGWIVGGEPLAARTLLAAAVIVTAVVIILLRQAKLEEMVHE